MIPNEYSALGFFPQFVRYRLTAQADGKTTKQPIHHAGGYPCDPTDPTNWADWDTAQASQHGDGIGFVFTKDDPFYFVDIDNCLHSGQWSATALDVLGFCAGAAVEVSQSGTGLHIIGMGTPPPHACKNTALGLELYHADRFVALTCDRLIGSAAHQGADLAGLVAKYFTKSRAESVEWTDGPIEGWAGHTDDEALLRHALDTRSAAGAFGGGACFRDLWECNASALAAAYPSEGGYDGSSADAALCSHLAFWTGKDCERIKRLMFQSALVRDKWEREDYIQSTVLNACAHTSKVHVKKDKPVAAEGEDFDTFVGYHQLTDYFKDCVYVRDMHRVLVPDGSLLKPEQFKVDMGGRTFVTDPEGAKTTRNPWDAMTETIGFRPRMASRTMFRPDLPSGEVFDYQGRAMVNNYVPVPVKSEAGDVSIFTDHLARLLPDKRDRDILLAYMAACVQHKGVKFQWTVLIQGVEGNGKTLFSRILSEAIGSRYVHTVRPEAIAGNFNSWIKDKIFVYVEDIYIPESRREVLEVLKPLITNDWQAVEPKGVDQSTEYVVANLMLNSNHKDAIRKTRNDRRFAVFYTAQQEEAHLRRDGMVGDYFEKLYDWLKRGGYAAVTHYLQHYPIPYELNPATGCQRAPATSSTEEAITESLGSVEQEVLEAISEGRSGFAGGWVSSMALDHLLDNMRAARMIPRNRRRELMRSLGYDYHPALKDGRVNNSIMPDNGKPRLYIKAGHIHSNLEGAAEVARHYTAAQMVGGVQAAEAFATV